MLELPRRQFLGGLLGIIAAPAIVKASSLMPIKPYSFGSVSIASGTVSIAAPDGIYRAVQSIDLITTDYLGLTFQQCNDDGTLKEGGALKYFEVPRVNLDLYERNDINKIYRRIVTLRPETYGGPVHFDERRLREDEAPTKLILGAK
jgi:hypothetical protein